MNFNRIIKLLLEASKDRFIDNTNLSDEEKTYYKDWFNKHPEKHNLINWQNKNELTKENFDKVIANSKNTVLQVKKNGLEGLEKVGSNTEFDFYKINSYNQAKFADSVACCGEWARWCIGWETSDHYWKDKAGRQGIKFVLAVRKNAKEANEKKYMIQIGSDDTFKPELKCIVWKQTNHSSEIITGDKIKSFFGTGIEKIIPDDYLKIEIEKRFTFDGKNIEITDKTITSLKELNLPKEISGDFSCNHCPKLTSLEGAPQKVGGDFSCGNCDKLTSLKGAPQSVGGGFYCRNCFNLTSLKGLPKKIGGELKCDDRLKQKSVKTCFNY